MSFIKLIKCRLINVFVHTMFPHYNNLNLNLNMTLVYLKRKTYTHTTEYNFISWRLQKEYIFKRLSSQTSTNRMRKHLAYLEEMQTNNKEHL